jgi:hypothetical protein
VKDEMLWARLAVLIPYPQRQIHDSGIFQLVNVKTGLKKIAYKPASPYISKVGDFSSHRFGG